MNDDDETEPRFPRTRAECADGPRPCPWFRCRFNLYLDVTAAGGIKFNFPDLEPEQIGQMAETCALDVVDRGVVTLEEIGDLMNLTRERVRQIEAVGVMKLRAGLRPEGDD